MKKTAWWMLLSGLWPSGAAAQYGPGLDVNAVSSSDGRGMLRQAGPIEDIRSMITEADYRSFASKDTRYVERSIELTVDERDRVSDCHDVPGRDGNREHTPLCAMVLGRTRFLHALTTGGRPAPAIVRLLFQFWFNPPGASLPLPPAPPAPPGGHRELEARGSDPSPVDARDLKLGVKDEFRLPEVTVAILPDGRAVGCTIRTSSRNDTIDVKACEKVAKARFRPATDGQGRYRLAVTSVHLAR